LVEIFPASVLGQDHLIKVRVLGSDHRRFPFHEAQDKRCITAMLLDRFRKGHRLGQVIGADGGKEDHSASRLSFVFRTTFSPKASGPVIEKLGHSPRPRSIDDAKLVRHRRLVLKRRNKHFGELLPLIMTELQLST